MGCNGLAILIAALADENGGAARRRRHTLVRASPMEVYGAGSSGAAGLLLRARGSVSWQRALRAISAMESAGKAVQRGSDVRSGCRVRRGQGVGDGVRAHARPAGRSAQRDADVQDDHRVVAGDAGLAGGGRGDDRGDGVDLDVLDTAVL